MRNALVVLNIGGKSIHPKSRESFLAACKRWGIEFVEVTKPAKPGVHHFWQKTFVIEDLQYFDRVLQLDADMLIRFDAPNPMDYCEPDEIGVVSCHQFYHPGLTEMRNKCIRHWAEKLNLQPAPDFVHVNGGLFCYSPKIHLELFREWQSLGAPRYPAKFLPEQSVLSILLWNRRKTLRQKWLPHAFNVVAAQSPARQATNSRSMRGWIYHFTGGNSLRKRANVMQTWWKCKDESTPPGRSIEIAKRCPTGGVVAELGVYRGQNAKHLLDLRPDLSLVLHDIWQSQDPGGRYLKSNDRAGFWTNDIYHTILESILAVNQIHAGRFMIRQVDLNTYTPPPAELYDVVFIDDDHTQEAVKDRIQKWWPVVKPGGFIGGHDYRHGNKSWGVSRAVATYFPKDQITTGRDLTWFVQKAIE